MRNIPNDFHGYPPMPPMPHDHLPRIPEPILYSNIQRGTTTRIPVQVRMQDGSPVDLSNFTVYFTMKNRPGDMVHDDNSAFICKEFLPQDPANGSFYILLSARETYLRPGYYYFDIELVQGEGVSRLGTFKSLLVDGVTNRSVIDVQNLEKEEEEEQPEDGQIADNELDVIIVTEDTKTDTIVILTNFGQAPAAQNRVRSVNGKIGDVVIKPEDIGCYTKEEIDEKLNEMTKTVNGKHGDVKITLEELGGLNKQEIKDLAYKVCLDFYRSVLNP